MRNDTYDSIEEWFCSLEQKYQNNNGALYDTEPPNRFLRIEFDDGRTYSITFTVLVEQYAAAYADEADEDPLGAFSERHEYGEENPQEVVEWARSELGWNDIEDAAVEIRNGKSHEEMWSDTDLEMVTIDNE